MGRRAHRARRASTIRLVVKTLPGAAVRPHARAPRRIKDAFDDGGMEMPIAVARVGRRSSARRASRGQAAAGDHAAAASVTSDRDRRRRPSSVRARRCARPPSRRSRRPRARPAALGGAADHDAARPRPAATSWPRVFALRTSPSTSAGDRQHHRVAVARRSASSSAVGPGAAVDRALLPPRPHFLGDERQERREQPQHRSTAPCAARLMRRRVAGVGARSSPARGSRRRTTRRTPRCARARGCSRSASNAAVASVDDAGQRGQHRPSRAGAVGAVPSGASPKPSANFDAFSILIARRRPTLNWLRSSASPCPAGRRPPSSARRRRRTRR